MPDVPTTPAPGGEAVAPPGAEDDRPALLVVEDEPLIALLLEDVLSGAGYRVLARAFDGPAALAGPSAP